MGYLDRKVEYYGGKAWYSHKRGRLIKTASGQLEAEGGEGIDLHCLLTGHRSPDAITLYPIMSDEMRVSGLHRGALAVVDRYAPPQVGKMVVVRIDGIVIIRKLVKKNGRYCLAADDPREPDFFFTEETKVERLGVVRYAIIQQ